MTRIPLLLVLLLLFSCNDEVTPEVDTGPVDAGDVDIDTAPPDLRREPAEPPEISGVTPSEGPLNGNIQVTVSGRRFEQPTDVFFGETAAVSVHHVDDKILSVLVPAGEEEGTVDVAVENRNGRDVLEDGFTYLPGTDPMVLELSPARGDVSGGDVITATGRNFPTEGAISVIFGSTVAPEAVPDTDTQFTITTPEHVFGLVDVTINYGEGYIQVIEDGFQFWADLSLDEIMPNVGVPAGGTEITLSGTGFFEATNIEVHFGENLAPTGSYQLDDTIAVVTTPAGTEGYVDVVVSGEHGTETLTEAFRYGVPLLVNRVEPATLPLEGGEVTIIGTGIDLEATIQVKVGDSDWIPATAVSESELTFTAPARDAGSYDLLIEQDEQRLVVPEIAVYQQPE